jgi:hypothetical protein
LKGKKMKAKLVAIAIALGSLVLSHRAMADLVTFEDQSAGPSTFGAAGPTQTLVYAFPDVTATFNGGVILTHESNQTTDDSNVYATTATGVAGGDPSLTNPLLISFNGPIQNFQIQILNALSGNYLMSDNDGHSMAFTLGSTGSSIATEGFAATGTQVTIDYTSAPTAWDFAIDNVTFDQPLGAVQTPLPLTSSMAGACGVALVIFQAMKKLRVARQS